MTRLDFEDGKYTVTHDNGAHFQALRYGAPWRDLTGDGLVLAMAQEVEALREQTAALKAALATKSTEPRAKATPLQSPEDLEGLRADFEEAVFLQYFLSTLVRQEGPGMAIVPSGPVKNKAEFLARDEAGAYVETSINPAWWAWKAANKKALTYTEAMGEAAQEYCDSFPAGPVGLPATWRWETLLGHMLRSRQPHGFQVGDQVEFKRRGTQFFGHVTEVESKAVVCQLVGSLENRRVTYLQSLRRITDAAEWTRLTEPEVF